MKKILVIILALTIIMTSSLGGYIGITYAQEPTTTDDFVADFSSDFGWIGTATKYLAYNGTAFGNSDGWNNTVGNITTKDTFNFGDNFDLHFSLYTDYRNGNKNGTNEDFYVTVGEFKIAICDFQTRVVIYHNDTAIEVTTQDADLKYQSVRNYNYDVHIEKGNITLKSDLLSCKSEFSDFEAQNDVTVSLTINETWHIYKSHFSSLSVDHIMSEERDTTFTADFSTPEQWAGLTEYLGFDQNKFGNNEKWSNKKGSITTRKYYDFGYEFDINFSLYTFYRNHNENGTNEDFYITVGDFKIAICDFQTRMKLWYKDTEIPLTGNSGADYTATRDYKYEIHIEKGNITLTSDLLSYTSDFENFESVNIAKVSVTINEDWQISKAYFGDLFVGKIVEVPLATEFRADFSSDAQWSGLTEYLSTDENKYAIGEGWNNKTGTLITKEKFNFGTDVEASFKLNTYYRNHNENGTNEDFYVTIGAFKIAICDFQTRIKLYYKDNAIDGTCEAKGDIAYPKGGERDYSYTVTLKKGEIVVESDLIRYESKFDGFEDVNKAFVSITVNESWQISRSAFSELLVNIKPEVKVYPECGNKLISLFNEEDIWEGDMSELIDKENGVFPSDSGWKNKKGSITTVGTYDFSDDFYVFTSLKTTGPNSAYKNNVHKTDTDFTVTFGNFRLEIKVFQNGMTLYYGDTEIGSAYANEYTYGEKEYTYSLHIKSGNIVVEQTDGKEKLLTISSNFAEFTPVDDALVSLSVLEDWQISVARFDYLIIAAASENITSAEEFFKQLEHDKYDWTVSSYGGSEFESDFSDKTLWTGDIIDLINTENKVFAPESGWKNTVGKIVSTKWYNFGESLLARFGLYTTYPNNGYKNNPSEQNLNFADYKVSIGDFTLEICYFQNVLKLYYGDKLVAEKRAETFNYDTKSYSYVIRISKGNILIRQMNANKVVLDLTSDFSDYAAVNSARIALEVLETWQVSVGRFSNVSVQSLATYNVLESFNAKRDIGAAMEKDDIASAWIKSQWSLVQHYKEGIKMTGWSADSVEKKSHISGFYSTIPTDPTAIPVIHIKNGDYTSQTGMYEDSLILRTNFSDSKDRATALCFEAPADGQIRIYDPEYGLVSVINKINGVNTWCMNSSSTEVKSLYFSIMKNDEQVWPAGDKGYLLANATHPDLNSAVTDFAFPDVVLDVKQGDKIYFKVTPKHYMLESGKILSNNPTLISMNPQIDYIRLDSEIKLNTDREVVIEKFDPNIASTIAAKSNKILLIKKDKNIALPIAIAVGCVIIVLGVLTVIIVCKKKGQR